VDEELARFLYVTLREGCFEGGDAFGDEVLASFLTLGALDAKKRGVLVSAVTSAATAGLARAECAPAAATPTTFETVLQELAGGGGGGGRAPAPPPPPPADAAAFQPAPHLCAPAAALCALLPQLSLEAACVVLERVGGGAGGAAERAAAWLLEGGAALEAEVLSAAAAAAARRAAAAAARAAAEKDAEAAAAAAKKATLRRFHEVAEVAGKSHAPKVAFEAAPKKGASVLRYVEGVPVHVRPGEKFLVEKPEATGGTLVALKIKKKGSGGASPNFK
jgi:hypothetical protein